MQSTTPTVVVTNRPLLRIFLSLFFLGAVSGLTTALGVVLWGAAWMIGLV
jgi:hypothetical protein